MFVWPLDRDARTSPPLLAWEDAQDLRDMTDSERVNAAFAVHEVAGLVAVGRARGLSGDRVIELLDADSRSALVRQEIATILGGVGGKGAPGG